MCSSDLKMSGCILIRFKFLSSEALDVMQSGKLDVVFTERCCKLFRDESVKSIHIEISEREFKRCRHLIGERGEVTKPEHQSHLKEAEQILDRLTVDECLLKEIPLCNHRREAILQQSSNEEKAKVLLEVMDRRPDHEFYQFLNILRRMKMNIAARSTKPVGKNTPTYSFSRCIVNVKKRKTVIYL